MISLPQSSTAAHSAGQGSMPIHTSALGGSSLPLPNISAVDSYSTVITDQSSGIGRQSSQQQLNVGSSLFRERSSHFGSYRSPRSQTPEHAIAAQVERFENAFQRLIDHSTNTGAIGPSGSAASETGTATGTTNSEISPVNMVNNPLYNAIFQTSASVTLVQNATAGTSINGVQNISRAVSQGLQSLIYPVVPSQPTFVPPPGNFTFDGPAEYTFQQQPPPRQHQQGSTMVSPHLIGQDGVPRIALELGQASQNVQGTNDRRFILYQNRVPGNNTAAVNLTDPHIPQASGVVVADPQIVPPHITLEDNREEQQWMAYEANQILNRNRAQAIG
ncbi:OLC1v1031033C1 [Oldenlandia corymbosa var. corymbosa]|uniref:OLC1v1031033C1 n=1 Tax=Oldenlandia corymbosa var. corymbosa TaxID=529605 RepID=A0AAV1CKH3_OLDCO|nr:OLC1v1031033C1 [Oldenlandia corymbosa var. corymbosa]